MRYINQITHLNTLKNNAIIIITVIILMGRVERKPDVVAFED